MAKWGDFSPEKSEAYTIHCETALATFALRTAGMAALTARGEAQLLIETKPKKKVMASKGYPEGKLVFVPHSSQMRHTRHGPTASQPLPSSLRSPVAFGRTAKASVNLLPHFGPPASGPQKAFVSPFWLVRRADKLDDCNMVLKRLQLTSTTRIITVAPEGALAPPQGAGAAKVPPADSWGVVVDDVIVIIMANCKAIAKGEELVCHDPKPPPQQMKRAMPVKEKEAPSTKKPRAQE